MFEEAREPNPREIKEKSSLSAAAASSSSASSSLIFMLHYIYNRPRPYRYSNMSSSNPAIHIKQSSFGIKYKYYIIL
jgi:hypothetical protein